MKGRSCLTNLLINEVTKILDDGGGVDVINRDYSKAFDSLSHKRLLNANLTRIKFGSSQPDIPGFGATNVVKRLLSKIKFYGIEGKHVKVDQRFPCRKVTASFGR